VGAAQAQGRLSGVAQDSVTHEPLAFASIFLANTTLGVTTTEQGKFEFPRVPAGTYDVVGSYVGYRLAKQTITMVPGTKEVTLLLAPTGNQLGEVVVKPAPNKPEEYRKFTELFIGGSTFSEQCHISNPDQVRVMLDDSTQELTARTKYRGLLKRRLVPVLIEGAPPPPGTPITSDGAEVGTLRSGQGPRAIAQLRIDALDRVLTCGGARLRADIPAWMKLPTEA